MLAPVAMLGLPSTGKTTYLAALYHSLADAPATATSRLTKLPAQRAYLEQIREAWLDGAPVGRTAVGAGEIVELDTVLEGTPVILRIPDVSGESVSEALVSRHADAALAAAISDSQGLLLFTQPHDLRPRVLLSRADEWGGAPDPAKPDQTSTTAEPVEFDPLALPSDVQLVDLLQWVATLVEARESRVRLAVVLSAWDDVNADITPQMWAGQLPMLRHYLDNAATPFDARMFGVSAQGGNYDTDPQPALTPPAERPYVVTETGDRLFDIAMPLRWAAMG